jgi:hypothetical protein
VLSAIPARPKTRAVSSFSSCLEQSLLSHTHGSLLYMCNSDICIRRWAQRILISLSVVASRHRHAAHVPNYAHPHPSQSHPRTQHPSTFPLARVANNADGRSFSIRTPACDAFRHHVAIQTRATLYGSLVIFECRSGERSKRRRKNQTSSLAFGLESCEIACKTDFSVAKAQIFGVFEY